MSTVGRRKGGLALPEDPLVPAAASPGRRAPADPRLCSLFSSSLYNAVVPSCGPLEGLSLSSPSPELSSPVLVPGPGPPSTPVGLVRLLLVRGISASVPGTRSWWTPPLPSQDPQHAETCPLPVGRGQDRPPPRSSIFSLNLVEKLRRLGLDEVVARGEMSYTRGERRGAGSVLT